MALQLRTTTRAVLPEIGRALRQSDVLMALGVIAILVVLILPLPPFLLDLLLALSIMFSVLVLLTSLFIEKPLDFSAFPTVLLIATMLRLSLNLASTRLILANGHEGPAAAGGVIEAFGGFIMQGNFVIGIIVFAILVIVNFVVITKGSGRIAEVAARFSLDAMPGKQMAIDADLSAGLIDESEARQRRAEVTQEADFYGAMDGASKFVRGDAIAGIIITMVNIVGGFAIGSLEKGWPLTDSISVFTQLTIGDGLVSQVPSFIIAIAAGLIVARTGGRERIGDEIPKQLAAQPIALYLISGFLMVLAFTPLPSLPLLIAASLSGGLAWAIGRVDQHTKNAKEQEARAEATAKPQEEQPVEELLAVDILEIEIGYGLVQLVDRSRGGDLLDRISMIRKQTAMEMGIVVPPVRIRDNMQLDANTYHVKLRGAVIGDGVVYPDHLMAMDSGLASGQLDGITGREPAFGLEATWIEKDARQRAETMNYTVVDATSVMATHLTELIRQYADELLTREEVAQLLEQLKKQAPKLVEEAVPGVIQPGDLQQVLQNLLRERVPIRDLETVVETLADWGSHTKDTDVLTEYVRNALRRTICHQYATTDDDGTQRLYCVTLDPAAEDIVNGYIDRGPAGTTMSMPPAVANRLSRAVSEAADPLLRDGRQLIVLTSPTVRAQVKQVLDNNTPGCVVLSYNEVVRGLDVESVGLVQFDLEPKTSASAA